MADLNGTSADSDSGNDASQNTNISYLVGALNATNSAIVTANTNLKSYVDGTYFPVAGGSINGATTIKSNLTVTGNLTVSGNVNTVSASNLNVSNNMIYLNTSGGGSAAPDLGFTGVYNNGNTVHTGFFRDHATGQWKVFENYKMSI